MKIENSNADVVEFSLNWKHDKSISKEDTKNRNQAIPSWVN